jgi:hypothetical protein
MHTDCFWDRLHYVHYESRSSGSMRDTFYGHPLDFVFGTVIRKPAESARGRARLSTCVAEG